MDRKVRGGFTLIEVIVVIAIMAIIMAIGIPSYTKWKRKYNIESDTREIFLLLNEARKRSLFEKKVCGVVWKTNPITSLSLACDTNNNEKIDDDPSGAKVYSVVNLRDSFNINITLYKYVRFMKNGMAKDWGRVFYCPSSVDVSYNCVVVSNLRINMGHWDGNTCTPR